MAEAASGHVSSILKEEEEEVSILSENRESRLPELLSNDFRDLKRIARTGTFFPSSGERERVADDGIDAVPLVIH